MEPAKKKKPKGVNGPKPFGTEAIGTVVACRLHNAFATEFSFAYPPTHTHAWWEKLVAMPCPGQ